MHPIVKVAHNLDEVEACRPAWESFAWSRVDAGIDLYLNIVRSRPVVVRPHAVFLEENGRPAAAAAARIEDISLTTRFGYKSVFTPRVRSLTVPCVAMGASGDSRTAELLMQELFDVLADREADVVWFQSLPVDSVFARTLTETVGPFRRQHFVEGRMHHRLVLPENFAEFVASRPRTIRKNIRYYRNKLERTFGDDLSMEILSEPSDLTRIATDLDRVAGLTYQRGLGVGFVDTPEERALLELTLTRRSYRAYVLYLRGAPIAFWTGWTDQNVFFIGTTGYDPSLADYSVGTYLLARVIDALCDDPSIEVVDYGPGDAPYKHQFGSESWLEKDVFVFASTPRNVGINVLRTAIVAGDLGAKRILRATGAADRLKRLWRRRLRPAAPPVSPENDVADDS